MKKQNKKLSLDRATSFMFDDMMITAQHNSGKKSSTERSIRLSVHSLSLCPSVFLAICTYVHLNVSQPFHSDSE